MDRSALFPLAADLDRQRRAAGLRAVTIAESAAIGVLALVRFAAGDRPLIYIVCGLAAVSSLLAYWLQGRGHLLIPTILVLGNAVWGPLAVLLWRGQLGQVGYFIVLMPMLAGVLLPPRGVLVASVAAVITWGICWLVVWHIPQTLMIRPPLTHFNALVMISLASVCSLLSAVATQRALAEARKREQTARDAERVYQALTANMSDVVSLLDAERRFIYVSPSAKVVFGRAPEQLVGVDTRDFVMTEDRPALDAAWRSALATGSAKTTVRGNVNGQVRWMELQYDASGDGKDRVVAVTTRDVTERRALEQEIRHARKMEAMGRMAGSVAHDFNNLLTVIDASTVELEEESGSVPKVTVQALREATTRGVALTRQLLAFARSERPAEAQPADTSSLLASLAPMLQRLLGSHIELRWELAPGLGSILCEQGQLEQLLLNLAGNARDAMAEGGVFTIAGRVVALQTGAPLAPGRYVELRVTDTGTGIPLDVRERIFEPFFTTKPHGKGTGLGLSICYSIVRQLGGSIQVDSTPGKGSTFTVLLPGPGPEA